MRLIEVDRSQSGSIALTRLPQSILTVKFANSDAESTVIQSFSGYLPLNFRNFSRILPGSDGRLKSGETMMTKPVSHSEWFLAPYCIGTKLRSLRTEKRLTLARLAMETGLSTALLSKLETDRMVPTLSTLATICRVYGVGMGHFFCEPTEHSLSVTRKVVSQGRGRSTDPNSRIPLNPGVADRKMDACLVDLAPGATASDLDIDCDGVLLVYVLDGRLQLDMGGMRESLEAGDCAYMESDLPTAWSAAGKQRCRLLTVTPRSRSVEKDPGLNGGQGFLQEQGRGLQAG
jgi:transcriptional regulator with XRE-family HTH domain